MVSNLGAVYVDSGVNPEISGSFNGYLALSDTVIDNVTLQNEAYISGSPAFTLPAGLKLEVYFTDLIIESGTGIAYWGD